MISEKDRLLHKKAELIETRSTLMNRIQTDQTKLAVTNKLIKDINVQIQESNTQTRKPVITDHALLRYIERVMGIDVTSIRDNLLPESIQEAIIEFNNGKFWLDDGTELRVVNRHVVTVIGPQAEKKTNEVS